ncbi:response regulator receiver-modulated signal transduction transcriptional regulator [Oleiphilus messinensis]|uniref:Response regulator receiver-modulated signal transduction transcriptional regulator n=1 Tax=Oleiphilus messinensis TaxID=141451 RepID=A0A1Y0IAM9_9GAMM|nr:response regulator transcription factor [Oleiphilus messinensis]ARU57219.1 response regulator receiver-modulated signal transduction transcriptional regulator [Oleiphilus messinensis]
MAYSGSILLVDDDPDLTTMLSVFLKREGFETDVANSGFDALGKLHEQIDYIAMVLDIVMPDKSGLDVLRFVRQNSSVPIILLTSRNDFSDRINGLDLGADDYLTKPFNPGELAARLRALLRRCSVQMPEQKHVSLHGIKLDSINLKATHGKTDLNLTTVEFLTLYQLMSHAGSPVSKEHLTRTVLKRALIPQDRSMDVHICRIRQKLSTAGYPENLISTLRGSGWRFLAELTESA